MRAINLIPQLPYEMQQPVENIFSTMFGAPANELQNMPVNQVLLRFFERLPADSQGGYTRIFKGKITNISTEYAGKHGRHSK